MNETAFKKWVETMAPGVPIGVANFVAAMNWHFQVRKMSPKELLEMAEWFGVDRRDYSRQIKQIDEQFMQLLGDAIVNRNPEIFELIAKALHALDAGHNKARAAIARASIYGPKTIRVLRSVVKHAGMDWEDTQIYRECKLIGVEVKPSKRGPKRIPDTKQR